MTGGMQFLLILCIILTFSANGLGADRKLSITYNEQCNITECQAKPNATNFLNLVHITAKGTNDTIHFLWSSIGAPAVLIARTSNEAKLHINWKDLVERTKNGSISFTPKEDVFYASSVMFSKLIEFNDTKDEGNLTKADELTITELDEMNWQNANVTIDASGCSAVLNTTLGKQFGNGTISFRLTAFGDSSRYKTLPYLQHTENSTQLDLTLQNMTSHFIGSRFAMEMVVIGNGETKTDKVYLHKEVTIDDEYTPAVFSTYDLNLPDAPMGSYSQWKPVCYTKTNRAMENARHVNAYMLDTTVDHHHMPTTSITHAFFPQEMMQVAALNISFGIAQDGFYKASNYSSWSATVGYGNPPEESMSITVYIVVSAGLGIPLIIVVFGGTGVCILKRKRKNRQTLEIN